MKLHLKQLLDRFNVGHFVFYWCVLVLEFLIGLRADLVIDWSSGFIFLPLWAWNVAVVGGLLGAIVSWCYSKDLRTDDDHIHHFTALVLSAMLQLFLAVTEVLVAVNIDTASMLWSAIFAPLYLVGVASLPICIWGCWRKRKVELEVLSISSMLQVLFLGLRLDNVTSWTWGVVFIPTWLLLIAFAIGEVIYVILVIVSYVLSDNQQHINDQRLPNLVLLVCASVFTISLIVFMALLVSRLDGNISGPYSAILVPLHIAMISLLISTLTRHPANPWWFGIKKTATDCALDCCPLLQELANVSFTKMRHTEDQEEDTERWHNLTTPPHATVLPISLSEHTLDDIYTPD